jgi:hypothetical protein
MSHITLNVVVVSCCLSKLLVLTKQGSGRVCICNVNVSVLQFLLNVEQRKIGIPISN